MKKFMAYIMATTMLLSSASVFALEGEMGYFGGITPGEKLPTMTELAQDSKRKTSKYELPYKETIYITGKPVSVEGTISLKPVEIDKEDGTGTYKESYIIQAEDAKTDSKITRNIILETRYVYDPIRKQTSKTSEVTKWSEIVKVEGKSYQLDEDASSFSKSVLEDYTPGVMYYSGDVVYQAVYNDLNSPGTQIKVDVGADLYGYDHAYAKTETQKRTIQVDAGVEQYYIEETPTFTSYKDLQYSSNEPEAMSFEGNYREVNKGEGALTYQIIQGNHGLYDNERSGAINVVDAPSVEQLTIVDLSHIKGHPAEWDVKKMYSLGIFEGNPRAFSPNQAVTKGEMIEILVRGLQIPIPEIEEKKTAKKDEEVFVPFTDIETDDPFYPYALAAYEAGLIESGRVDAGKYIKREELYSFAIKAIGLQRMGIGAGGIATPFIDDAHISAPYKNSVYAASKINLIPMNNGYFLPQSPVKYMDIAVVMNSLLDYLRYDLQKDYNEKMM